MDKVAIVGGGICGLALALNLHRRGIDCTVYERAEEIKPLGVGITLLPHAMREFAALGVADAILAAGIENRESCFFNRFGQLVYREDRGRFAGYALPEVGIHRGRLHAILYAAACERLGAARLRLGHQCVGVEQDGDGATVRFVASPTQAPLAPGRAEVVIDCEGINSALRAQFYPGEQVAFAGINTWRGVTRHAPILTGRSYLRIGALRSGKMVIYPIADDVDGDASGRQLINWVAEYQRDDFERNDWNQAGRVEDFVGLFERWRFDWLDVPALIRDAEQILEYPMVDRDPVERWTFGRVTLAGDAAHPMYPRGSNGAAQAVIDARTLADCLEGAADPCAALGAYEAARRDATANIVRTNRAHPPDVIIATVEERVGDRPFDDLERYVTQDELRALSENYKRIAGFTVADVGASSPRQNVPG